MTCLCPVMSCLYKQEIKGPKLKQAEFMIGASSTAAQCTILNISKGNPCIFLNLCLVSSHCARLMRPVQSIGQTTKTQWLSQLANGRWKKKCHLSFFIKKYYLPWWKYHLVLYLGMYNMCCIILNISSLDGL